MPKAVPWHSEPKGPAKAEHMFTDAGGERVELLAYDTDLAPSRGYNGPRLCGFEVYGRDRPGAPFWNQLAAGESISLEQAKTDALAMVARPREEWAKLPRSWVNDN